MVLRTSRGGVLTGHLHPRRVVALIALLLSVALAATAARPAVAADQSRRAAPPTPLSVLRAISKVTSEPRYAHSTWGVAVTDLATGSRLYGQRATAMFVPGSIMKIYSTSAALAALGPGYRFRTPVYRLGTIAGGVLAGNLALVASADFSMGLRERPDGTMAFNSLPALDHSYANIGPGGAEVNGDPLAGLTALARQVRASGIRRVSGDVVIDQRFFTPFGGWPDGLIAPMWINENLVDVRISPTRPGRKAAVAWRPRTAAYAVESTVTTVPRRKPTSLTLDAPRPRVIRIRGQIAAGSPPALRVWPIADPAAVARTAFIEALRRAGVSVEAPLVGPNPIRLVPRAKYRTSDKVAEHVSGTLAEFVKVILKVSYNRGADLMVCLVAARTGSRDCEQGLVGEFQHNVRLGADRRSTYAFDGAGSDERDRTTPNDMVVFLRNAAKQPYGLALRRGLPVLGVDGTLATTQKGSPAAGRVQAKTGNRAGGTPAGQGLLTGNALAGYAAAKSGRQVVFAIMVRDVPISSIEDVEAVTNDQAAIAAAVQQGY